MPSLALLTSRLELHELHALGERPSHVIDVGRGKKRTCNLLSASQGHAAEKESVRKLPRPVLKETGGNLASAMDSNSTRLLAVGTYEHAVVGFGLQEKGAHVEAKLTFTNAVHAGAVRCVASCGHVLSSGGADEAIQLCHLSRRVELGSLLQHEGTVNCIAFHSADGRSFMFSASDDGSIIAWKFPHWECLHILRGHKGPVNSFSLHSSGRLALSVGRDRTLRTWNLINGRLAYTTRLPRVGQAIDWSPDGLHFGVLLADELLVYEAASVSVRHQIKHDEQQFTTFLWLDSDQLLVGTEDGSLLLFGIGDSDSSLRLRVQAHKKRVKAITVAKLPSGKACVASAGSDSKLCLWDIHSDTADCLSSASIPGRPTCMTFCDLEMVPKPSARSAERRLAAIEHNHQELDGKVLADDEKMPKKSKHAKKRKAQSSELEESKEEGEEEEVNVLPKKRKKTRKDEDNKEVASGVSQKKKKERKPREDGESKEEKVVDVLPERKTKKKKKKSAMQTE